MTQSEPFSTDPRRSWKRKIYNEADLDAMSLRQRVELETDRDFDKPIEQLVCDVHEETHNPKRTPLENIASAQKRMVSMMARVAKSNQRTTNWMIGLTVAITVMTLLLTALTFLMWRDVNSSNTASHGTALPRRP